MRPRTLALTFALAIGRSAHAAEDASPLDLGARHEEAGRLASAAAAYEKALALARRENQSERITEAEERLAAVAPRIPKLTVRVTEPAFGVDVFIDDLPLSPNAWNAPQRIDPGTHRIDARARGKRRFLAEVALQERAAREIVVPLLDDPPPERPPSTSSTQRILGFASGGLGVASLVAGAVLGFIVLDAASTADQRCPGSSSCYDTDGLEARDRRGDYAPAAALTIVSGVVLLATGFILLSTAPGAR